MLTTLDIENEKKIKKIKFEKFELRLRLGPFKVTWLDQQSIHNLFC